MKLIASIIHSVVRGTSILSTRSGLLAVTSLSIIEIVARRSFPIFHLFSTIFRTSLLVVVTKSIFLLYSRYTETSNKKDLDKEAGVSYELQMLDLIAHQDNDPAGAWSSLKEVVFSMNKIRCQMDNASPLLKETGYNMICIDS
jgi:hypothetical protein